jgi:hypothetical protein
MRYAALIFASLCLVALDARADDAKTQKPIPDDCPVTLPTEPRYVPLGQKVIEPGGSVFLYGWDALFTQIYSDGRWRGIKTTTGTRNKSAWFRKNAAITRATLCRSRCGWSDLLACAGSCYRTLWRSRCCDKRGCILKH